MFLLDRSFLDGARSVPTAALLMAVALGVCIAAFPVGTAAGFAVALAMVLAGVAMTRAGFSKPWHLIVIPTVTLYIVLNHGFANLTIHPVGVPLIVGHALMFSGLFLAVGTSHRYVFREMREPAMVSLIALMVLAALHLIGDTAEHGLYAIRDSSVFLEGVFLLLGLLWAREERAAECALRWLLPVFVLNLVYTMTYPWRETVQAASPVSGIFRPVAIVGHYNQSYLYLLAGALFCLWLGPRVAHWPGWVWKLLVAAQLLCLTLVQTRSMYVGVVVVLLVVVLLGEFRQWVKIASSVGSALLIFVLLTSSLGIELEGRLGPTRLDFLWDQVRSLSGEAGTPGMSVEGRMRWYRETWDRVVSSDGNFLIGEGFGEPLLSNAIGKEGVAIRQPHNTHLSVMARLGLVGAAIWAIFHLSILARFARTLRRKQRLNRSFYELSAWFLLYYLLSMLVTSVQPLLEFSYGAIPFYLLMGLVLGLMRRSSEQGVEALVGK